MDTIVLATVGFAFAFLTAWLISPGLRAWIERPKFQFQESLDRYDDARRSERGHL